MNQMLVHAHSGLRWVVVILMLTAIFKAFGGKKNDHLKEGDRKIFLFAMISFHTQWLIGLILYIMDIANGKIQFIMGETYYRFYAVEHITAMTLAFVLITIGHSKSKKAADAPAKYKKIAVFYSIAFIIVLASIPWPFRNLGAGWF